MPKRKMKLTPEKRVDLGESYIRLNNLVCGLR